MSKKQRVGWESKPFMFRLRTPKEGVSNDEIPVSILDEAHAYKAIQSWIETGDKRISPSAHLTQMIIRLVSLANKHQVNPVKGESEMSAIVRVLNRRFDNIQSAIEDSKTELLRAIIANPQAMQVMNEQHRRITSGETVDDDFINNILEDFGR